MHYVEPYGMRWYVRHMLKEDAANVQTAIRVPVEWMPRLRAIAGRLSRPGIPLTASDAMRAAIAEGLVVLERQLQIAGSEQRKLVDDDKPPSSRRPASRR